MPPAEQDRSRWDTHLIAEGVTVLQAASARDRLGEYQAQAAIAALHADARTASETDWVQIVEFYDELLLLTDSPIVRLNRAVAIGEADGPRAGLAALDSIDPGPPRYVGVTAYLLERASDLRRAAAMYVEAARTASSVPGRDHLTREAAPLQHGMRRHEVVTTARPTLRVSARHASPGRGATASDARAERSSRHGYDARSLTRQQLEGARFRHYRTGPSSGRVNDDGPG